MKTYYTFLSRAKYRNTINLVVTKCVANTMILEKTLNANFSEIAFPKSSFCYNEQLQHLTYNLICFQSGKKSHRNSIDA